MSLGATTADLLERFHDRQIAALSRAVSLVENHGEGFESLLTELHTHVGHAQRIGITGPPGAGKSTLTDAAVAAYREQGRTVAVVAVDPTSPFSGGALLGDRVRMDRGAGDDGVFIRSMATRGAIGGLAMTTLEVCDVLDAFGFERIIVETVGVGQSELAVAGTTDSTVLVLVPESGDAVQVLKAGVMEVGDVFVVNKSDRPHADRIARDLEEMLSIRDEARASTWRPPVIKTIATDGTGVPELISALDARGTCLAGSGELEADRRERRARHTRAVVDRMLQLRVWGDPESERTLQANLDHVLQGDMSAYEVARLVLENHQAS